MDPGAALIGRPRPIRGLNLNLPAPTSDPGVPEGYRGLHVAAPDAAGVVPAVIDHDHPPRRCDQRGV